MFANIDMFHLLMKHVDMTIKAFYLFEDSSLLFFLSWSLTVWIPCQRAPQTYCFESRKHFYDFFELFELLNWVMQDQSASSGN